MGIPTVYKWTDEGAPVCTGNNQGVIKLLKACLVDGYGSKAAAGWAMPFSDVDEKNVMFRNNPITGTGMYCRVDYATTNNYYANFWAYESATDENTGVNPLKTTFGYIAGSNQKSDLERPWIIIADDRFFYIFIWNTVTTDPTGDNNQWNCLAYCFGDIVSLYEDDPWGCMFLPASSSSYGGYVGHIGTSNTGAGSHKYIARKRSGLSVESRVENVTTGPAYTTMGVNGAPFSPEYPEIVVRPYLTDGVSYSMRGYMPGLYSPGHAFPYNNLDEVTIGDKTFLVITGKTYSTKCQYMIEIDNDWRL